MQAVLKSADVNIDSFHAKLIESLKGFKAVTKTRVETIYTTIGTVDPKATAISVFEGAHKMAKEKFPGPTETVETLAKKASEATYSAKDYIANTVSTTYGVANTKIVEIQNATTVGVTKALEVSKVNQ